MLIYRPCDGVSLALQKAYLSFYLILGLKSLALMKNLVAKLENLHTQI